MRITSDIKKELLKTDIVSFIKVVLCICFCSMFVWKSIHIDQGIFIKTKYLLCSLLMWFIADITFSSDRDSAIKSKKYLWFTNIFTLILSINIPNSDVNHYMLLLSIFCSVYFYVRYSDFFINDYIKGLYVFGKVSRKHKKLYIELIEEISKQEYGNTNIIKLDICNSKEYEIKWLEKNITVIFDKNYCDSLIIENILGDFHILLKFDNKINFDKYKKKLYKDFSILNQ